MGFLFQFVDSYIGGFSFYFTDKNGFVQVADGDYVNFVLVAALPVAAQYVKLATVSQ